MTHGSLFSGIGGFDLAAQWMGWTNIFQVEIDEYCQRLLAKNFPHTDKHTDIKQFDGTRYEGTIDIISGGFPCQPFSQAGERRGTDDPRHLWPQMLRIIKEIRPRWIVGENVSGIFTISDGMVFEQVLADLEDAGYETQPYRIPAAAVGAPHRRDRWWFIARNTSNTGRQYGTRTKDQREPAEQTGPQDAAQFERPARRDGIRANPDTQGEHSATRNHATDSQSEPREFRRDGRESAAPAGRRDAPDATDERFQRSDLTKDNSTESRGGKERTHGRARHVRRLQNIGRWDIPWIEVAAEFCRMDDGLPVELDGFVLTKNKHREARLKGLGNAIVPQVAFEIFQAIQRTDTILKNETNL